MRQFHLCLLLVLIACVADAAFPSHRHVAAHVAAAGGGGGNVTLMLHCNNIGTPTTFIDSSPLANTITAVGDAQQTAGAAKWGAGGCALDGIGDRLSLATSASFDFTNNWTMEAWIKLNGFGNSPTILSKRATADTFVWKFNSSGNLLFFWMPTSTSVAIITGGTTCSTGTWYYCAVTKEGNDFKMYLNGTQEGSTATHTDVPSANVDDIVVGAFYQAGWTGYANASIDDVRITIGEALTISTPTEEMLP